MGNAKKGDVSNEAEFSCHFHLKNYRNPRYKNDPIEKFTPVKRKSKPNQFNFMDITNDGFVPGVAPSGNRTQFLDSVVEEMIKLVHQHNDTPTKTPIEYQCDAMKGNSLRALLKANDEMTSTK